MLDSIVEPFREQVSKIPLNVPTTPILSNLSGTWLTEAEAVSPEYWARHLRHTVRFADCAAVVAQHQDWLVLEVGPGETLLSFLRQMSDSSSSQTRIHCIRQPRAVHDDYEIWLSALSRMWIAGAQIDWPAVHKPHMPRRLPLPSYPFERQRYWISPVDTEHRTVPVARRSLEKQVDPANWFYVPTWRKSSPLTPAPAPPLSQGGVYVVIGGPESFPVQAIADRLAQIAPTVRVTPADSFQQLSHDQFALSPHIREHWDLLLSALTGRGQWPERILHTLSLQLTHEENPSSSLDQGFFTLMALAQAIGNISSSRSVHLSIITSKSYSVAGEPVVNPIGASLNGFAKVFAVESSNIRCSVVDVDTVQDRSSFAALLREVTASPENNVIALRHTTRWTQSFDAVPMNSPLPLHDGSPQPGAYLITGGLGGLGLVFAEELARIGGGGHFVLTGRTPVPSEDQWESIVNDATIPVSEIQRISGLLKVRAAGGKITTLQADVSDAVRMREIVSWCHQNFSGIRGVIHAAGIPSRSMILTKTREEAIQVFQPKLQGTLWIEELLDGSEPDFILLCSSISAVVPTPGLSDYAAANAYLDAFAAKYDSPQGTRVISVNWDTWTEVGMAVEIAHKRGIVDISEASITHAINAKEGAAVLSRVLSFPSSQVVVSTRDLGLLLEHINEQTVLAATHLPEIVTAGNLHPRPNLSQSYVEPADDMESAVSAIWAELLGIDKVGRYDNFFELGGHSLLGTQVMARIRQRFGLDLPLRTVFEASTPAEMTNFLRAIPWASGINKEAPTLDVEREEIEL
jgi:acyl transferase domain-containing protein